MQTHCSCVCSSSAPFPSLCVPVWLFHITIDEANCISTIFFSTRRISPCKCQTALPTKKKLIFCSAAMWGKKEEVGKGKKGTRVLKNKKNILFCMHPSRRAAIFRGSNNAYTSTAFRSPSRTLVVLLTSLVLVCVCLLLSSFSVLHRTTNTAEDVLSTHHIDAVTRTSLPILPSQQQQQQHTGSSSGVVETLHRFLTQQVDAPRQNKFSTSADVVRKLTGQCGQIPSKHENHGAASGGGQPPAQSSQDWVLYAVDASPSGDRSAVHLVIVPVRMLPYCRSGQWMQQQHAEKGEHAALAAIRRAERDSLDHTVSASPQLLEWLQSGPRMGPNWFEGSAIELSLHQDGIEKDAVASLWFERHEDTCSYVSTTAVDLTRASSSSSTKMVLMVDHLHKNWNHLRERDEEAHFDYVLQRVSPGPLLLRSGSEPTVVVPLQWNAEDQVTVYDSSLDTARGTNNQKEATSGTQDTRGLYSEWRWISTGADPIVKYANSVWKGYWLTYKTMSWSHYDRVPNLVRDYLGRMNYGRAYRLMRSSYAGEAEAAPAVAKQEEMGQQQVAVGVGRLHILELLRDRRLYFIGDSQIRIFFYGFLTRLGIDYPLDKVWRGDRTDHIRSHNVTVSYVASYFLNLSRPTALEMLADPTHPIVIAGVGQHHSCHCWSVEKHAAFVKEALQTLQQPQELLSASVVATTKRKSEGSSSSSLPRQVIWFDVPAQPFNTHLYRKKPIGQSRKDCRNNARHMLYAAVQRNLVAQYLPPIATKSGPSSSSSSEEAVLPIVNAFRSSIGMQHTSLDGAHYYTWVREAWIDELVHLIEAQQRQNAQPTIV